jgi:NADH:ubiquinone oxidoreductase subunit 4 (subunit M)
MEILLRRLLGLYFVVSAVAFVPAALFYLGVQNAAGPWWVMPAVPLAQAVVFAVAGLVLVRQRARHLAADGGVVFPPVPSLLQLLGVYFIVEGASAAVGPAVDMLFLSEGAWARFGNVTAAAVWLVAGWTLVRRPQMVADAVSSRARP